MTAGAWFDKRITRDKLDLMDEEFTSRYGKVREVKEGDNMLSLEDIENVINEFDQVYDEETIMDIVDYDETTIED